jgi:hypothetical protein
MIFPHPLLNEHISIEYIDEIAEREGYEQFIPYTFLTHLVYVFSFYRLKCYPFDCIQERNEYTDTFRKLISILNLSEIKTDNPVVFAIRVLQIVAKKTNLRKLEQAAITGFKFEFEDETKCQNYKFDLHKLSQIQLETLGLKDKDLDTIELSAEILRMLLLYDGMSRLSQPLDPKYDVIKKTISSYNDFYKVRKYRLALPTYGIDLATKKLQITKVSDTEVQASEVILAIDCSLSMMTNQLSKLMIRSVLLYYIGIMEQYPGVTIIVVPVIGGVESIERIVDVTRLQEMFHHLHKFILPVRKSDSVFQDLNKFYPGKSVIFLSDGNIKFKELPNLKFKLYSISLTSNNKLKQMCLLSGGQFIILK